MQGMMQLRGGTRENPVIGLVRALGRSLRDQVKIVRAGELGRPGAGPGKAVDAVGSNPSAETSKAPGPCMGLGVGWVGASVIRDQVL